MSTKTLPAKTDVKSKRKSTSATKESTISFPISLRRLELFKTSISSDYGTRAEFLSETQEIEHFIAAKLNNIKYAPTSCIGFVDFLVKETLRGEPVNEMKGIYLIYLSSKAEISEDEWKRYLQFVTETTAWSKFVDLFVIINAQSGMALPPLPVRPPGITFENPIDEEATAKTTSRRRTKA